VAHCRGDVRIEDAEIAADPNRQIAAWLHLLSRCPRRCFAEERGSNRRGQAELGAANEQLPPGGPAAEELAKQRRDLERGGRTHRETPPVELWARFAASRN